MKCVKVVLVNRISYNFMLLLKKKIWARKLINTVHSYQSVITISYSECTINPKQVKHSPCYRNYGAAMNISQTKISLTPCQKTYNEDIQNSKRVVLLLLYLFSFKNFYSLTKEEFKRFSILNWNLNTQNYTTLTTNKWSEPPF